MIIHFFRYFFFKVNEYENIVIVAIDEPGGNRNRSINIKAQHKTRRAAITQIYF